MLAKLQWRDGMISSLQVVVHLLLGSVQQLAEFLVEAVRGRRARPYGMGHLLLKS
jgi:hypothetical protein